MHSRGRVCAARRKPAAFCWFYIVLLPALWAQSSLNPVIEIGNFEFDRMTVAWQSAETDSRVSLDIRWKVDGEEDWATGIEVPITDLRYVVPALIPSTRYAFSFRTRSAPPLLEYGPEALAVAETLSETRATNIRASEIGARSVRLVWERA
eukprot:1290337-Rhodomonas_salina.8